MSRLCLAISSFRNDVEIERLLREEHDRAATPFSRIFVVDSLGTGRLSDLIQREGWDNVTYFSAAENIGSAGNLALRLELAERAGFQYCYTVNHDGVIDHNVVEHLLEVAEGRPKVGAVYPLRYLTERGCYDLTGLRNSPLPLKAAKTIPNSSAVPVFWGSSNGALYSLEPVRAGLRPWSDLWMGWEDLGYGWLLHRTGYQQFLATQARVEDDKEYVTHSPMPRLRLTINDKPSWYAYYQLRNLILITRRNERPPWDYAVLVGRIAQELLLTSLFRKSKRARYALLIRGIADGIRGRSGKGKVP